jgi:hypothetical protein
VVKDILARGRQFGSLSEKQIALLNAKVERVEAHRAAAAASQHIGTEGERLEVEVTVTGVASYSRAAFGQPWREQTVWAITMTDACRQPVRQQDPVVHRGGRRALHAAGDGENAPGIQRRQADPRAEGEAEREKGS